MNWFAARDALSRSVWQSVASSRLYANYSQRSWVRMRVKTGSEFITYLIYYPKLYSDIN